jgi:hypothetical protein
MIENTNAELAKARQMEPLPDTVTDWVRAVVELTELLPALAQRTRTLAEVPGGGDPRPRIDALLKTWHAAGYAHYASFGDPGRAIKDAVLSWLQGATDGVTEALVGLGAGLEMAVSAALKAGGGHDQLLCAGDFSTELELVDPVGRAAAAVPPPDLWGVQTFDNSIRPLVVGNFASLRSTHPLKKQLSPATCYQVNGTVASVVLGHAMVGPLATSPPRARPWYYSEAALQLTQSWASGQARRREIEEHERLARQKAQERMEPDSERAGRLAAEVAELRRQIAQLRGGVR